MKINQNYGCKKMICNFYQVEMKIFPFKLNNFTNIAGLSSSALRNIIQLFLRDKPLFKHHTGAKKYRAKAPGVKS